MESTAQDKPLIKLLEDTIVHEIVKAYESSGRNARVAAKLLGISKDMVYRRIKKHRAVRSV